jgi:hypothetical protein
MGLASMTLPVRVIRRDGWDVRLRDLIEAARDRPFEYGVHDCSTFAMLELPKALSGEEFRGRIGVEWADEKEAMALLDDRGLEYYVTRAFGEPVQGWRRGRRGDIAMVNPSPLTGNLPLLAVIVGAVAAVPAPDGLAFVKADRLEKVWRLG